MPEDPKVLARPGRSDTDLLRWGAHLNDAEFERLVALRRELIQKAAAQEGRLLATWQPNSPLGHTSGEKEIARQLVRVLYQTAMAAIRTEKEDRGAPPTHQVVEQIITGLDALWRIRSGPLKGFTLAAPIDQLGGLVSGSASEAKGRLREALSPVVDRALAQTSVGRRKNLSGVKARAFDIAQGFLEQVGMSLEPRYLQRLLKKTEPAPAPLCEGERVLHVLRLDHSTGTPHLWVDFYSRSDS